MALCAHMDIITNISPVADNLFLQMPVSANMLPTSSSFRASRYLRSLNLKHLSQMPLRLFVQIMHAYASNLEHQTISSKYLCTDFV